MAKRAADAEAFATEHKQISADLKALIARGNATRAEILSILLRKLKLENKEAESEDDGFEAIDVLGEFRP